MGGDGTFSHCMNAVIKLSSGSDEPKLTNIPMGFLPNGNTALYVQLIIIADVQIEINCAFKL